MGGGGGVIKPNLTVETNGRCYAKCVFITAKNCYNLEHLHLSYVYLYMSDSFSWTVGQSKHLEDKATCLFK